MTERKFINFAQAAEHGDYLIITAKKLREGSPDYVEEYRAYRSSEEGGNYTARIFEIEELADQFAYGQFLNPLSVRNFVRYAREKFTIKPKMVYIIGKGSGYASFRNTSARYYVKKDITLVPTFGQPSSDNLLVSETLQDPTPAIAIGRLSAVWPEEVGLYLDKVKQYEGLARNVKRTADDMEWRKEILHLVGGDDEYLALNIIKPFMASYERHIEDKPVSGEVATFMRVENADFAADMKRIQNRIDSGAGLITYFGHSSTSSIDFNLSKPESFNPVPGKYPVMIANGCRAGDIFTLDVNRLQSKSVTITENYIFAKDKGAIAFIANTDFGLPNYLDLFTNEWYIAVAKTAYGKPLGEVHREAIRSAFSKAPADPFNRINLEQECLHGDPAIVLFPYDKPDYTTDSTLISLSPALPTVATDSLSLSIPIVNIGKAEDDKVEVKIERILPDGKVMASGTYVVENIYKRKVLQTTIPLQGLFDAGKNIIRVTIDPEKKSKDLNFENNVAEISFELSSITATPVFPYPYSIVNYSDIQLTASTANPLQAAMAYRVQIDTSARFNSPLLITMDSTKIGGAIGFVPKMQWKENTVYYWRISPVINNQPVEWQSSSFLYSTAETPGFNQSHYYQWENMQTQSMILDSVSRKMELGNQDHNLFVEHGVYATSGVEDTHFSLTVDGIRLMRSACVGQSIIFNVFDGRTFEPWSNQAGGRFGSGPNCGSGREYNFEFKYFSTDNRQKIMAFLDEIPDGNYVAARLNLDQPHDSALVSYWMRDTLKLGSGKSLYHTFKALGFDAIDSMNRPRTFAVVFRKGDQSDYPTQWAFSDGLYDRNIQSFMTTTQATSGSFYSPVIGTAAKWEKLRWQVTEQAGAPKFSIDVLGLRHNAEPVILKSVGKGENSVDLSAIDASVYPSIQLRFNARDTVMSNPPILNYWRVNYVPVADGALSAAHYLKWDTDRLFSLVDSLNFGLAFHNPTKYPLDATKYRILLGNENGEQELKSGNIGALSPGQSGLIELQENIDRLGGRYYLKILVNEERNPAEQYYFNNRAVVPFTVDSAREAVIVKDFKVVQEGNNLTVSWISENEIKVAQYELLYGQDTVNMRVVQTFEPKSINRERVTYSFNHMEPIYGANIYRLRIIDTYGNSILVDPVEYSPAIVNFSADAVEKNLLVTWKTQRELRVSSYALEKMNGQSWLGIETYEGENTGVQERAFSFIDPNPRAGKNVYRLTVTDNAGGVHNDYLDSVFIQPENLEITGEQMNLAVTWDVVNEINLDYYVLEQSFDNLNFTEIARTNATDLGAGTWQKSLMHTLRGPGQYFYRVKAVDRNGNFAYSNVVEAFSGDPTTIYVYPNPFREYIWIVSGNPNLNWSVWLYDSSGKLLISENGSGSRRISTLSLPVGVYYLRIAYGESNETRKLLKLR